MDYMLRKDNLLFSQFNFLSSLERQTMTIVKLKTLQSIRTNSLASQSSTESKWINKSFWCRDLRFECSPIFLAFHAVDLVVNEPMRQEFGCALIRRHTIDTADLFSGMFLFRVLVNLSTCVEDFFTVLTLPVFVVNLERSIRRLKR